jgi:shikimate kinase / 3-dehydroquinate synthase
LAETPNIVLTGFMGTGKSSVGRYIAERLGRPFVDVDERIASVAGRSIPDIFAEEGEAAFRSLEADAVQALAGPAGLVIATGGGAVMNPANRAALMAGGTVVCLDASAQEILTRLQAYTDRPMLSGNDRHARVTHLLAERGPAYEAIPHHVQTTGLSVPAVAERVLGIAAGLPGEGRRLIVRIEGQPNYDVLVAEGVLAEAGPRLIAAGLKPGRCAVITNPTVARRHTGALLAALADAGFEPFVFDVPDGEAHKTLDSAAMLYGKLAEARLARGEPIIALGGGVIGDLAGFVAATWLRGVPFVQIPTSLLAMVDASVGGKVAVDLPQGKNLVGAFKQPAVVLADPGVLSSLPAAEFRAGLAEVVKAALIGDPVLFSQFLGRGPTGLTPMIADAVRVKAEIVERDPYEMGDRAWLNLGHTFGHSLELLSDYSLRHGEAVSVGMVAAAELSARLGYCTPALAHAVRTLLARLALPTSYAFDVDAALAAMGTDKKRRGRSLRFVVIEDVGRVRIVEDVPEAAVRAALNTIRSEEA